MKKFQILKIVLLAFIAFQFTSCDDEPLTGTFNQPNVVDPAETGEFVANIEGQAFFADSIRATLSLSRQLEISGRMASTNERITIIVDDADSGIFSLNTTDTNPNVAIYSNTPDNMFPYTSSVNFGGGGSMTITEFDLENLQVSGTFNFEANRIARDEDGIPILDANGLPTLQTIIITSGSYKDIPLILENQGDPEDEFFAKVDGVDFIPTNLFLTQTTVGNEPMFRITATKDNNELIRIDLPKFLGDGTFDFESISDGTKLIGFYNDGVGGQNLTSNPGTITLTQFNIETGILTGTFEFTGTDPLMTDNNTVEVTEGNFSFRFEGTPNGNSFLNAYIDEVYYNAETGRANDTIINGFPAIYLRTQVGSESINITLPAVLTLGTYPMFRNFDAANKIVTTYKPIVNQDTEFVSNPGTMEILEFDADRRIIIGTFSLFAKDNAEVDDTIYRITAGRFRASY